MSLDPTLAPLVLRLGVGAVFIAHALAKAFTFTFAGTAQYFAAHGFPGWTAYPVFFVELAGGAALLAGLRTRWVALALLPVIVGAIKPHAGNGWMFTAPGGGWEYPAFLLVALVAVALGGSGPYSLDAFLARARRSEYARG